MNVNTLWLQAASQQDSSGLFPLQLLLKEGTAVSDEAFTAVLEAHPAAVAAPCPFLQLPYGGEGDATVVVTAEFESNQQPSVLLPRGTMGTVLEIDDDGDARIRFVGIDAPQWVLKSDFGKLARPVEGCPNALHAVLWLQCGAARVEAVMRAWPEVGV